MSLSFLEYLSLFCLRAFWGRGYIQLRASYETVQPYIGYA